ncbi:MAG: ABC transporter permease [Acidobacteriota bacterium]|nr:ABC transporter permease [Acidobacteriota bacterium]
MVNKMIFANILHRPVRTIVSILAVAIEVAMVLLVVGLTTGMLSETAKRIEGVGADIMVQPPNSSFLLGVTTAPMPIKIGDRIKDLDHVHYVAPVLLWFDTDINAGLNIVYGIDMKTFDEVSGGFVYFSGGPLNGPYDILVDDWYARSHHLKVGDTVKLLNHDFSVVGVVEHGKGSRLFIPIATAQQMLGAVDRASIFFVKCTGPGYTQTVLHSIEKLLPGYKVLSIKEYMSMMTSNNIPELGAFVNVMIAIAVGIGFLVIFLSMYTTITERTREIGILKSLGASKAYIINLILKEAGVLSIAGIIAGLIGVVLVRRFIGISMPTVPMEAMHAGWVARAAALAIGGALVGAFYPALRASRLDPVEALGYE